MNRLQSLDPRIRKLMRAICFCLLFVILFIFLSGAFIPRTGTTEDGMESRISKAYRGEPRDSIDTVFIGNSDIYRAISPVDLFHQTGITSAIAGRPNKQLSECPGIYGIFCATRTRKPSYWKPTVCFQELIQDSKKEFLRWKQKLPRWMWLARRRRRQRMLM